MAATIVETDVKTVTLRLLSAEVLPIIQHLERVHLLEILPPDSVGKPDPASWIGAITPEEAAQWQEDLKAMRAEWDRDS